MIGTSPTIDIQGLLPLKRQLEILAMPKRLRRRLLSRTAREVIRASKGRVRAQTDLQGQPFAERKRPRSRKMLSRLARELTVLSNDAISAKVGFKRGSSARIAARQQHGVSETVSAQSLPKMSAEGMRKPATRRQARELIAAGMTIKGANGKRRKKPSQKWIMQNMNIGQAGAALRYLWETGGEVKKSWKTTVPARSFLGATRAETTGYLIKIVDDVKREMNYVTG